MASKPLEGLFAINKPPGVSSAQLIRNLQYKFRKSELFKDDLKAEAQKRNSQPGFKRKKGRNRVDVKMGHGGTLDPLATGVLVIGLGSGTKKLNQFLASTKEYEAGALLGCSTDTYDRLGKVLRKAPYEHVTKTQVEEALNQFRGDIMQIPPIYSALNMNGKRLYEYARAGEPLPKEIEPRAMKVDKLELLNFTTDHQWTFPEEEAEAEMKITAEYITKAEKKGDGTNPVPEEVKRKIIDVALSSSTTSVKEKKPSQSPEPEVKKQKVGSPTPETNTAVNAEAVAATDTTLPEPTEPTKPITLSPPPPLLNFRLTVSSGFYIRSFVHDLGAALNSASHMVSLVRTRQGDFSLGNHNTIDYQDFESEDASVWEDKLERVLREYMAVHSEGAKGAAGNGGGEGVKEKMEGQG